MRVVLVVGVLLALHVGQARGAEARELSDGEEVPMPDSPIIWYPDNPVQKKPSKIHSSIEDLLSANAADRLPALDKDPTEKDQDDLGEGMDATPDTHESIDLVMQVNQMEVHAEDITENILAKRKADKERELGEARRAKPKPLHLPPEQPMKKDLHSEIDALFSANIADPGVPDHEETQMME